MKKKLKCILLVDDSEPTNLYHANSISKTQCAEKIVSVGNGKEALEFLIENDQNDTPPPELLLLDINMPGMSGWEFLDQYNDLDLKNKGSIVTVMLSTSPNPYDIKLAEKNNLVSEFMNKPLKKDNVIELLQNHFPEYL